MNRLVFCVALLLSGLPHMLSAAVINNIQELDSAALFRFSIMSDNKGNLPGNSHMTRCDNWVQGSQFVLGLGDHTKGSSTSYLNWIKTDSYWKSKFYPNIADGENETFGSGQGDWGAGEKLFDSLPGFWGRSNVQNEGNSVDYYCWFNHSGFTVHVIQLHYSDSGPGLVEESRAFMQSKLESIAATKTDKDIVLVLAHSTGGDFVSQANFNSYRKELLLTTADFCGSATTHKYGWWDRYKNDYGANGSNAVPYNTGSVGSSGGTNGFVEIHVVDNPPRMIIQYLTTEVGSRTLHSGTYGDFSQDNGKYGTPIIKEINGPWYELNWNNIELGPVPNNAEFVSHSVPSIMNPGETQQVSVTMRNTGEDTWRSSTSHRLGAVGDDTTWTGSAREQLTHDVPTNSTHTFTFNITAPSTPGTYNFQWRMVQDGVEWFGDSSPAIGIPVGVVATSVTVNDDTEELIVNGNVAGSSDLEFIYDDAHMNNAGQTNGDQIIGLRFSGVQVPSGVVVSNAYVQFTGDAANAGNGAAITLNIAGHDTDNSGGFAEGDTYDVSNRTKTSASVNWNPPAWSAGSSGSAERSVNISSVIQEIIDRPGWNQGNGLSLIISGNQGLGTAARRAESLAGVAGKAPVLHIEYGTGNQEPVFTSSADEYAEVGTQYSYTISTTDGDGDPVTLSAPNRPGWLNLSGNVLSGTPQSGDIGTHSVTLRANDGTGTTDQDFSITVSAAGNDAPVITSSGETAAIENQAYSYTITATDADGDSLSYSASNLPSWLSLSGNTVSGTPSSAQIGLHSVELSVSDGSVSVQQNYNVYVFETPAPSNLIQNGSFEDGTNGWSMGSNFSRVSNNSQGGSGHSIAISALGGGSIAQTVTVQPNTDYNVSVWIDASQMTSGIAVFDLSDKPTPETEVQFVMYNPNGGWQEYTGSFNSGTETSITLRMFTASTFGGTVYFDNIVFSPVDLPNAAPQVISTPPASVVAGNNYQYTFEAVDVNGDSLTYSAEQLPGWLTFNQGSGLLHGTPQAAQVGGHQVTLRASDGTDHADQVFVVTVDPPPNQPPVWNFTSFTISNATENSAYNYSIANRITDPEGDNLTFTKSGGTADWISVSSNGTLSGTPLAANVGFNTVLVTVSDGVNNSELGIISLTVDASPLSPLETWMDQNGVTDEMGDDDGDGISNIVEYALGGDPNAEDAVNAPVVTEGTNSLDIEFDRAEAGITYTIQKSTDLVTWTDHIVVNDSHGTVGGSCTVSVPNSEMNNGKLFLRLKVND